ncbi:PKD domain-containing protein [Paraferrimonas sp. SM1919]|uniref:PKD domain-containing protein n=1 Tax=Paraferrimonas sp. SM1919 TaxID=2662263 RepID=UPI0013CFF034|nr:PKD domain-containing protein [Paraferrimonas sp. SM1919]
MLSFTNKALAALALTLFFIAKAQAHTVQICWLDQGGVTTFYAGTYHSSSEGPSPIGGIIIDGQYNPFSGWIQPSILPATAQCYTHPNYDSNFANLDGVPHPGVNHFQTFTSGFEAGQHSLDFSRSTVIEWPWAQYPNLTFGGAACNDADFDGICNNDDPCPLDAANDGDGDGICGNVDNCPLDANPDQLDDNFNGQGDACEGHVCGNGLLQGNEQCDDGNIAGGDGCSAICTLETLNSAPVADAGLDSSVNEGITVILDGSASSDPDGDQLSYQWLQTAGTNVTISNDTSAQASFVAPEVALGGETLSFSLTVSDSEPLSASDTVNVSIVNINHVPVADAGEDVSISEGSLVNLDGTSSFDSDGDVITYSWLQTAGPIVSLSNDTSASLSFTAPIIDGGDPLAEITLVFTLTVDDGLPMDAPVPGYQISDYQDSVMVTVTNINTPPVADAGADKTVNENNPLQLNGNASSDPDGDSLSYSWAQISGPSIVLVDANTATPSLTAPFVSPGGEVIELELTVEDPFGGIGYDQVLINVQNENDPPLASAAIPTVDCIWPPNHNMVTVGITGVSDPEDNAVITIDSVTQDEPTNGTGDGDTPVDAVINADGTVQLRAERSGNSNGRVYFINFTASDYEGSDSGTVEVCVRHNKKKPAVDDGQNYDSTE